MNKNRTINMPGEPTFIYRPWSINRTYFLAFCFSRIKYKFVDIYFYLYVLQTKEKGG